MLPSTDLLIAGAGPSGLSAAINAASEGLHVTLIDPGTIGGQARWSTAIENVPGFPNGITGKRYADRALRQARKFGTRLLIDMVETFCRLTDGTIAVQLHSARMIETRVLLLASGQTPKPLDVPGANRFGVFTGANPDDLPRYRSKTVAIVGGGNSAGQAAIAFVRNGAAVTLFARRSLDQSMSQYLISRLMDLITLEQTPVECIGRSPDNRLTIGSSAFDAVFSFVGAHPIHSFPVACDDASYVTADTFRTSVKGVYAIGDVRSGSTKRISTAVGEGSAVVHLIHREAFV